jgi:hypothetical protein
MMTRAIEKILVWFNLSIAGKGEFFPPEFSSGLSEVLCIFVHVKVDE